MVIPKYLNFYSIIFIQNLYIHLKHYEKEYGILGMVKIKFLEVKLQHFSQMAAQWLTGEEKG